MNALPKNVEVVAGQKPGPSVVVMGAVHGNERVGAEVIVALKAQIHPAELHGTLTLILGNPAAYAINQRFVDQDLNRLFGAEFQTLAQKDPGTLSIEEKRALEMAPFLEKADYLLDIHSTIKPSVPFVYCESTPQHLELARLFQIQYIVSPDPAGHVVDLDSSADNHVDRHGGVGLTYEAGWHKEANAAADVIGKTYYFLQAVGSLSGTQSHPSSTAIHVEIYETLIPSDQNFKFEKDFSNFDRYDDHSLIIFPKVDIVPGKPAGYLARIKTH